MHARRNVALNVLFAALFAILSAVPAAHAKTHTVILGAAKRVPYSKAGDPAGAAPGEDSLKIRALLVDGALKEWTTGGSHDITDRSFVVRRVIHLNDSLPTDKPESAKEHWVWQRGPWLLVDRVSGKVTALKLPDYDPGVSQVSWFRDYAAYCGLTASGKSLYAIVAQVAARKPVLAKKLAVFDAANQVASQAANQAAPACTAPDWQREPLRITFHPTGKDAVSYDIVPGSAVLVEDTGDETEAPDAAPAK